jgi:hypothetical protein
MSAQHTPGPWHTAPSNSGNLCIFGEIEHRQTGYSENCICAITPLCDQTRIDRSNANLIAAAPELLEALEEQERCMQWMTGSDPENPFTLETMRLKLNYCEDVRKSAIAKAKGAAQ